MKQKVIEFVKDYYKHSLKNEDCIERYLDYRDEFPESIIEKVLSSDTPEETFWEEVNAMDDNCDDWYYEDDFWKKFNAFCEENGFDSYDASEYVYENFYWVFPDEFLNPTVDTVWIIDTGDGNYDFALHNVLNWQGDKHLQELSGLYWLAKQQRKLTLLKKEVVKSDKCHEGDCEKSKFVESCITELVNCCTHMAALTFLVRMPLKTAIELEEYRAKLLREKKFGRYSPQDCKKNLGYIILNKSTVCGLYDDWNGSGSLLEIELEKDVKLPIQFLDGIYSDKRIQQVYGLTSECWKETIKDIKLKED